MPSHSVALSECREFDPADRHLTLTLGAQSFGLRRTAEPDRQEGQTEPLSELDGGFGSDLWSVKIARPMRFSVAKHTDVVLSLLGVQADVQTLQDASGGRFGFLDGLVFVLLLSILVVTVIVPQDDFTAGRTAGDFGGAITPDNDGLDILSTCFWRGGRGGGEGLSGDGLGFTLGRRSRQFLEHADEQSEERQPSAWTHERPCTEHRLELSEIVDSGAQSAGAGAGVDVKHGLFYGEFDRLATIPKLNVASSILVARFGCRRCHGLTAAVFFVYERRCFREFWRRGEASRVGTNCRMMTGSDLGGRSRVQAVVQGVAA